MKMRKEEKDALFKRLDELKYRKGPEGYSKGLLVKLLKDTAKLKTVLPSVEDIDAFKQLLVEYSDKKMDFGIIGPYGKLTVKIKDDERFMNTDSQKIIDWLYVARFYSFGSGFRTQVRRAVSYLNLKFGGVRFSFSS